MIGAGGIDDADKAIAKIEAGATLLQLYSALVFNGPVLVREIVSGIAERLQATATGRLVELIGSKAEAYQN